MANDFLSTYAPLANDIATRTGVDPSVVLGIIDTETGGGRHVSGNNIFGISPGGRVAGYPDVQTASQAFINLMQTPRYRGVAAAGDPASQAAALVRGGYNTANPQYASLVANKALNFGKQLGYQDSTSDDTKEGPAVYSTSAQPVATADDSFVPPTAPQPPAQPPASTGSAKDRVLSDPALGGGNGISTAPAASSAKDRVLADPALSPPAEKSTAATQPGPSIPSPDEQSAETGLPLPSSPSPALNRITGAAAEGWSGVPAIPRVPPDLVMAPVYNPLIAGVETALRGGGALLRGGQQAAVEILPNQLGRDVAALPEAFPFGFDTGPHPLQPNKAPPRPQFVSERTAPPRPPGMTDAERIQQLVEHSINAEMPPPAEPPTGGPPGFRPDVDPTKPFTYNPPSSGWPAGTERWAGEAAPATGPQPGMGSAQPAGAQVTPGYEAIHTPAEEAAYRATAEGKKLLEPQLIGERDTNQYIPGETVNNAEREQTVKTARELKELGIRVPEASDLDKEAAQSNNTARTIYAENTAKGPVEIANRNTQRQTDIEADKKTVFAPDNVTGPVDHAPIVEKIQEVLNKPENRQNDAVQTVLRPLIDRLQEEGGAGKISDPREMWGLRQQIDRWTSKRMQSDDNNLHYAAHELGEVSNVMDQQIEKAAPGYDAMIAKYAEHSRAIDEMTVLQGALKNLRGTGQTMTYNDFQRFMKNVVDSRMTASTDLNAFKSISPENMQRLWNIRDSLRRTASAKELARAAGSDTMPNIIDALKGIGKMGGTAALHAYVGAHLGPGGNFALQSLAALGKSLNDRRMIRRATQQMQNLLRPSEPLRIPPGQENALTGAPPP